MRCHAPTAFKDRFDPGPVNPLSTKPARSFLSNTELHGISCDYCHKVTGPDHHSKYSEARRFWQEISNVSHTTDSRSETLYGNIANPETSLYSHEGKESKYIQSSFFCASCHDVQLNKLDFKKGQPHQRLENLGTEHLFYSNKLNRLNQKAYSCQDCHMSLYPLTPPGIYPLAVVAEPDDGEGKRPLRRHAMHNFTAVSIPFLDDPRFPDIDTKDLDIFGYPKGQKQRRELMLRAAVDIWIKKPLIEKGYEGRSDQNTLKVQVALLNNGAGHRVPSGFSEAREVFLEIEVKDDKKNLVYRSGYTNPNDPHENLAAKYIELNKHTLEVKKYRRGPDYDQRPKRELGLVSFRNRFYRCKKPFFLAQEFAQVDLNCPKKEEVFSPDLADWIDNTRSLPPMEEVEAVYDIPVSKAYKGNYEIKTRLRYRTFPPYLLSALMAADHRDGPENKPLMTVNTLKKNSIVDMAEAKTIFRVEEDLDNSVIAD